MEPDTSLAPGDGIQLPQPDDAALRLDEELWKAAYSRLEDGLRQRYETILRQQPGISKDLSLDRQAAAPVELRMNRVENRQWTYTWRGRSRKIRDQVHGILDVVEKTAGVVSFGLQFAPPFVSLPWAGITTILPVSGISCLLLEVT